VAVSVPPANGDAHLMIYPNPAKDWVTIQAPGRIIEISMADYSGRQVYHTTGNNSTETIPTSALPAGLYFLKVTTSAGTVNKKLVIE
jgi:hypothetical protein